MTCVDPLTVILHFYVAEYALLSNEYAGAYCPAMDPVLGEDKEIADIMLTPAHALAVEVFRGVSKAFRRAVTKVLPTKTMEYWNKSNRELVSNIHSQFRLQRTKDVRFFLSSRSRHTLIAASGSADMFRWYDRKTRDLPCTFVNDYPSSAPVCKTLRKALSTMTDPNGCRGLLRCAAASNSVDMITEAVKWAPMRYANCMKRLRAFTRHDADTVVLHREHDIHDGPLLVDIGYALQKGANLTAEWMLDHLVHQPDLYYPHNGHPTQIKPKRSRIVIEDTGSWLFASALGSANQECIRLALDRSRMLPDKSRTDSHRIRLAMVSGIEAIHKRSGTEESHKEFIQTCLDAGVITPGRIGGKDPMVDACVALLHAGQFGTVQWLWSMLDAHNEKRLKLTAVASLRLIHYKAIDAALWLLRTYGSCISGLNLCRGIVHNGYYDKKKVLRALRDNNVITLQDVMEFKKEVGPCYYTGTMLLIMEEDRSVDWDEEERKDYKRMFLPRDQDVN